MTLILDGGMGRELLRLGAPFRQPEWSALALIEAPEFVTRAHEAFAEGGAQVLTTNSYAIVPFHIGDARFAARGCELAALAGQCARDVANQHGLKVAGSLPPALGSYRPELFDAELAREIQTALIDGLSPYADIWLAETLSSLEEARVFESLLARDERPLWLSFTLHDEGPARLRSGESIADAAALTRELGADALLFNCSAPEVMDLAVRQAREALGEVAVQIGVYANGFDQEEADLPANEGLSEMRDDLGPQRYLAFAKQWVASGASIVGGCCGVGPEHINALSAGLDRAPDGPLSDAGNERVQA